MSGSFVGTGGGDGSFTLPGAGGTLAPTELAWAIITTPPTDTPAVGAMRQYINESGAAPYRRLYTYSDSGWNYVEN